MHAKSKAKAAGRPSTFTRASLASLRDTEQKDTFVRRRGNSSLVASGRAAVERCSSGVSAQAGRVSIKSQDWPSSASTDAAFNLEATSSTPPTPSLARPFDVLILGDVFTGCMERWAECVAFSKRTGCIAFVGSRGDLSKLTRSGVLHQTEHCHVYETSGLVLPAFHDAHCHPFGAGNRLRQKDPHFSKEDESLRACAVDLSSCKTWKDAEQTLVEAISSNGDSHGTVLAERCHHHLANTIAASSLEKLAPGIVLVVLVGVNSDEVIVNETALNKLPNLCKLWTYSRSDPHIERTEEGHPSGRFCGAVWATRFALLSSASIASKGLRGLLCGLGELGKHGIVACTDAFVFEDRVPIYEFAFEQDDCKRLPRTSLAIGFKSHWDAEEIGAVLDRVKHTRRDWADTGYRFCVREAKVEVDNVSQWSSRSSSKWSKPSWDLEQFDRVVETMVGADFSMHMHTFGDLAAKHSLQSLQRAEATAPAKTYGGTGERRHKLAHVFELLREDEAYLSSSLLAVFQPYWFDNRAWSTYDDEAVQVHQRLTEHQAVCYGSDWDISSLSPLEGMAASLARTGAFAHVSWPDRLAAAIYLQTCAAARAMWLEKVSGTLEAGKLADICILDQNIFTSGWNGVAEAKDTQATRNRPALGANVVASFAGGVLIYERDVEARAEMTAQVPGPPLAVYQRRKPRKSDRLNPAAPALSLRNQEDATLRSSCSCSEAGCNKRRLAKYGGWCTAAFGQR